TVMKPSEVLVALWENVEQNWENDTAHSAFLDACVATNNLPYAAQCYRGKIVDPSGDFRLQAERQLSKVSDCAMRHVESTRKALPVTSMVTKVIGLLLIVGIALFWLLMMSRLA